MLNNTERNIIEIVRKNRGISRIEIVEILNLSKPVVSVNIKKLIDLGFIREIEGNYTSKKFGRKRIGLSFVPDCMHLIGIDVGGTKIEGIVGDLDGNIVKSIKNSTRGIKNKDTFVELVKNTIKELKKDCKKKVAGIGIGIPGTLDVKTQKIKYMPAFDLSDVDLKTPLEKEFKIPVYIENDVTLDAYAESRIGAGKGYKNIVLISIGTGIGSGIIIDGTIYRGSTGKAGEVGNMITDWTEDQKFTGKAFGYLEQWFSGAKLEERFAPFGVKEGFEATQDAKLQAVIKEGITHLGLAISNTILILNPEIVILKGGIGYAQYEKIMSLVNPLLERVLPYEIIEDVKFAKGRFKEFGVAIGGVFFAQKNILQI